jgi:hypothetical protein
MNGPAVIAGPFIRLCARVVSGPPENQLGQV